MISHKYIDGTQRSIYLIKSREQYVDIAQPHFDSQLNNRYDDVYFQNKALIFTYFGFPSGPLTVKEDSLIKKSDDELVFNVRVRACTVDGRQNQSVTYYKNLLEISNAGISNVSTISFTIGSLK